MALRGAIYRRLSVRTNGNVANLDAQEADCRALAAQRGVTVVGVLTDHGESAFDRDDPDDRPGYAELCDAVRDRKVDVVLAWHTDRLWRDDLERALFMRDARRAGLALVVTPSTRVDPSNADDEFTSSILTAVARKESADKSRRIRRKQRVNAEAGRPHGGRYRPFGYESDKVTVRADEADLVREIARRLLSGESLRSVARWLNTTGHTTTAGGPFAPDTVRNIATSPRYAGLRAVDTRTTSTVVADAVWKPIITRVEHDKLRALLLDPARKWKRPARSYLLTGHIECGKCGAGMIAMPHRERGSNGESQRNYACSRDHGGCGKSRVVAEPVEQIVVARLGEYVATEPFRDALRAAAAVDVDPAVSRELGDLDARDATLAEQWAAGTLSDAAWAAARKVLTERRVALSSLVRKTATLPVVLADYVDDPARLAAAFEAMPFARQRAILAALVDSVVICPPARHGPHFDPSRVHAVRWRALPGSTAPRSTTARASRGSLWDRLSKDERADYMARRLGEGASKRAVARELGVDASVVIRATPRVR